ncbi:hypothetical protein H5410_051855 [Solanum commersonii]|uniref:Uncharacterized protein n=1 Tax=Solanum commersonii TaxID=4109 RepID=A0A9J5X1Q4_SOLCO|nr:hypothetical protein H5410_051855 [Solanum commersonii]
MESVFLDEQTGQFSSSNDPKANFSNGSSWPRRVNWSIFKFKLALKQVNLHFADIRVLYIMDFS